MAIKRFVFIIFTIIVILSGIWYSSYRKTGELTFAKGSNNEDRFVSGSKEELEAAMAKMTEEDDVLKTVMAHGVGFYYKVCFDSLLCVCVC